MLYMRTLAMAARKPMPYSNGSNVSVVLKYPKRMRDSTHQKAADRQTDRQTGRASRRNHTHALTLIACGADHDGAPVLLLREELQARALCMYETTCCPQT